MKSGSWKWVIFLVRRGQAAFGSEDDGLSPLTAKQARRLREHLGGSGDKLSRLMARRLRPQRTTVRLICDAAGWSGGIDINGSLDEYDHRAWRHSTYRTAPEFGGRDDKMFHEAVEHGLHAWVNGRQRRSDEGVRTFLCPRRRSADAGRCAGVLRGHAASGHRAGLVSRIAVCLLDGGVGNGSGSSASASTPRPPAVVGVTISGSRQLKAAVERVAVTQIEELGQDPCTKISRRHVRARSAARLRNAWSPASSSTTPDHLTT